ncbi:MAG: TetR/AcrR family transcriptional regulator [Solirubrobacteraceae bacterium]
MNVRAGGSAEFDVTQVSEIQRARILSAMFDLADKDGAGDVSIARIVERAGVSRRTFYDAFADRDDCFLAAFERGLELAGERVLPAFGAERKWREKIRAGLLALLSFLDEEPAVGRLLIVESSAGGPRVRERRDKALAVVAVSIDEGRAQTAAAAALPPLTAEGLVGGVLSVIASRLVQVEREPLSGLANQLMSMIVLPYEGARAARRELERPLLAVSSDSSERAVLLTDPFKDMGMRLTYRTVRVLLAVAEHPGASNRQVGDSAGISDQGQISKLLGRLRRLELISNTGLGHDLGAPNVWSLTEKGQRFAQNIRTHADGLGAEVGASNGSTNRGESAR